MKDVLFWWLTSPSNFHTSFFLAPIGLFLFIFLEYFSFIYSELRRLMACQFGLDQVNPFIQFFTFLQHRITPENKKGILDNIFPHHYPSNIHSSNQAKLIHNSNLYSSP